MKVILLVSALFIAQFSYGVVPEHSHNLPANGRTGLHGMVLYGSNGIYFLDHIPMNHPPHDFQVITEVALKSATGKDINIDLSKTAYTLKPQKQFSLNNYINGQLLEFTGEVYSGSFEQNGKLLKGLEKVFVTVKSIKYARQIPSESLSPSLRLETSHELFEIHSITPAQNYQSIKNITTGQVLWCVKGPDFFDPC